MRVCVAGGGLAGTLLAWRLAADPAVDRVDVMAGGQAAADATAASGGVVRGYEPHPEQRRLAADSLAELLASPVLRRWSAFRPTGCLYVRAADPWLAGDVAEVEARLPGSTRLLDGGELSALGWAGLPDGTAGVLEPGAGCIDPGALRAAVLADLAGRPSVAVLPWTLDTVLHSADRGVACWAGGRRHHYDAAVVAAGAWTPRILVANGFPAQGFRTKSIQYTVYRASGRRPGPFVDETTGLYGRPVDDGMLLGLATDQWGVVPGRRPPTPELHDRAARLAAARLPGLELGPALAAVDATDCYADPPTLGLRPVARRLWTFTGGSGGSAKTALAASRRAADHLVRITETVNRLDIVSPQKVSSR